MSDSLTAGTRGGPLARLQERFGACRRALFRTPLDAAVNLAALALFAAVLPPLLDWALLSAVWDARAGTDCPHGSGACWGFIAHKYRLILFGRYPYDAQWRPLLATLLLLAMTAVSFRPRLWGRGLVLSWLLGLALYGVLMSGGILGLPFYPTVYWGGLPLTILLSVMGIFFGFLVSLPAALGRRSKLPVIRITCVVYIELVRGVPLISVLFLASVVLPIFLPEGLNPNGLARVLFGLVLFFGAYMAEVIRGGLQAIPRGQYDACHALGLSYLTTMHKVILPQALEIVIPAMINLFIGAFKGTSLVVIIAMMDLLGSAQASLADPNWIGFYVEAYVFAGAIYVLFCSAISWYGRRVETGLRRQQSR